MFIDPLASNKLVVNCNQDLSSSRETGSVPPYNYHYDFMNPITAVEIINRKFAESLAKTTKLLN